MILFNTICAQTVIRRREMKRRWRTHTFFKLSRTTVVYWSIKLTLNILVKPYKKIEFKCPM